jgi:predicted NACHT family NTPase
MSQKPYHWSRFWCPREAQYSLADRGYLVDPTTETGKSLQPEVRSFEHINESQCLIMLGEPGIGKSTALATEHGQIDESVKQDGDATLWINLRSYQTDIRLQQSLFDHPIFKDWLEGQHRLHLFLDSLDECLLRVKTIASLLADEFKKYPIERLFLRMACRTVDWPHGFENDLRILFGDEHVQVFELLPLRRIDVEEAAKTEEIDHECFLSEVEHLQIVPLAIKPITLKFLLTTYQKESRLPATQSDLYSLGCRLLCEETSDNRRDSKETGTLSADQRLSLASRIAGITVFCNYYAVWMGPNLGDKPDSDVSVGDTAGRAEGLVDTKDAVDEHRIIETLSTGLFSSRGANRIGWAHQTYAEFLAARYVLANELNPEQVLDLILHPTDGKVIPQLHQTAAWLATLSPQIFQRLTTIDPEVLLRSDVTKADEQGRRTLVASLLDLYDREELLDTDWELRREYGKLNHSQLAAQLRSYITDKDKGRIARRVAVEMGEACNLAELSTELLSVALDDSEDRQVRIQAAYALSRIGDAATRTQLRPLAEGVRLQRKWDVSAFKLRDSLSRC